MRINFECFYHTATVSIEYGDPHEFAPCWPPVGLKSQWYYEIDGSESPVPDCSGKIKSQISVCQELTSDGNNSYSTMEIMTATKFSDARLYTCKDSGGKEITHIDVKVIRKSLKSSKSSASFLSIIQI